MPWWVGRSRLLVALRLLVMLAVPLDAGAEQPGKVFRIGILGIVPLTDPEGARLSGAFIQGLREIGYVEGRNITIRATVVESPRL